MRFKNTYQSGFLSILYSIGSKPLQIWDKKVRNGHIKRLTDSDIQSSVLEIMGTNVSTTYITCPSDPAKTLGIKLPFLVMIIKNLKKYFTFEVTVLDDKEVRRRFRASNYQSTTRVKPFICTMPMRLDEGWNAAVRTRRMESVPRLESRVVWTWIQFNLSDFTRRAYGTNYIETLRVQLHANCRIRRIYFSDRLYSEEELPPEFKLFLPVAQKAQGALAPRVTLADTWKKGAHGVFRAGDRTEEPQTVMNHPTPQKAKTALLLPDNVATLMLGGYKVNVSQHVALSPLQLQLRAIFQVIGAATGFVAYNATGLDALQYTIRSGLLEKEGLQAQYAPQTPSTTPAVEQVKSGQADLCQLAVAASFAELERLKELQTALSFLAQVMHRILAIGKLKAFSNLSAEAPALCRRIFNSQSLHSRSALINAMLCKTRKSTEKTALVHFAQINAAWPEGPLKERDGFFLVGRTKDFQWRDLENKEVLVDHLFQPLALMKYACHLQNVDYSKMKVVDAGSSSLFLQTRWNHGDFVHLQGPAAQKLEYEGKGVVVASMGDVIGPEWLKTDVARAFMRAYRQGRAATAQLAAKEVAEVVQPFFSEVDPEVLVSTVAVYQKMGCWDGEVEIPKATYEKLLDAFLYSGVISKRHPYDAKPRRPSSKSFEIAVTLREVKTPVPPGPELGEAPDTPNDLGCASAYLAGAPREILGQWASHQQTIKIAVQNAGLPLQLLEARCSPQLREYQVPADRWWQLGVSFDPPWLTGQVELPELDVGDLELELLKAGDVMPGSDLLSLGAENRDLDEVAEELLRLFQVAFGASVPKLLDGYISLRGRAAVNDMLEEREWQSARAQELQEQPEQEPKQAAGVVAGAIDVPAGYTSVAFLSATLVFFAAAWRMPIMDVDYDETLSAHVRHEVHLCWIFLRRKPGESSPASQSAAQGRAAALERRSETRNGLTEALHFGKLLERAFQPDFMHKVETFDPLPHEEFLDLARLFQPRVVSNGEAIIKQGSEGTELYFIQTGLCSVRVQEGQHERQVATLRPGAYFGEVALIEHEPHNASVYAQGEVLLYGLHKSHFYDFRLSERLNFQLKYPVARNALQIIFGRTSRRIRSFYKVCFTLFLYLLVSGIMFHYLEGWGYSDCIYFAIITLMTVGYGDLVPKNWFSRIWLVLLILVSWVLVAHAIGEFLDRMVRLEMKNEKARKSLRLRRPRHEVFDEAGRRRHFKCQMLKCLGALALQLGSLDRLLFVSCLAAQTLVLEKPNWTDWTEALYFSVVTLATIGYGDDVTPKSEKSKLSIGLLALIGVPLFGLILGRIVQITYGKARRESLPEVCGGLTNETFDQSPGRRESTEVCGREEGAPAAVTSDLGSVGRKDVLVVWLG
ncbi:unnamed protein product [Durusdinium trenchii]|uniref:Cyclic nucleotide-binding domain-containing protein n=1 Tax=Durusdinium trenchii TaxID=1381693 RepID=A0ABP0Q787_9DINO